MNRLDKFVERCSRDVARRTSRRSFLAKLSVTLVGAAAAPLLPVARGAAPQRAGDANGKLDHGMTGDPGDPDSCDYWRHCAIDGFLCGCCGGTVSSCPPGTSMSAITWIGTCHNPGDGRDYVISYNDCCGRTSCNRCFCDRNERDTPLYQPGRANDYNWCSGNSEANIPYHCSTARIVGFAE